MKVHLDARFYCFLTEYVLRFYLVGRFSVLYFPNSMLATLVQSLDLQRTAIDFL